ncbi:MAG: selenoneine synthase SenA [Burkholderiales bacterium]
MTNIADASRAALVTRASPQTLMRRLQAARARTRQLAAGLDGMRERGPRLASVNPPLWEFGHLAWFQERWCLRWQAPETFGASLRDDADRLYDSTHVAHATRWDLPLPGWPAVMDYQAAVQEAVLTRLTHEPDRQSLLYFAELAVAHEEMHDEAFVYTRQTLGYEAPVVTPGARAENGEPGGGDVHLPGGEYHLGAAQDGAFVFDNEKWAHPVALAPFAMARSVVSQDEYAAFVDAGGYGCQELWTPEGWRWRAGAGAEHPAYWRRQPGGWEQRVFDRWQPLARDAAVVHVNAHEAEAWCRWAGRRLPRESEWEQAVATTPAAPSGEIKRMTPWGAATADARHANLHGGVGGVTNAQGYGAGDSAWGLRQAFGNVWEWTADPFAPYPGYVRDPYREYSEPWFGTHRVLRGGCFATEPALLRTTWRNFFTPDRRDVIAGFRTCAL